MGIQVSPWWQHHTNCLLFLSSSLTLGGSGNKNDEILHSLLTIIITLNFE